MLNIIYSNQQFGPGKVAKNLILGLDILKKKYVINQPIKSYSTNIALQWSDLLLSNDYNPNTLLVGPNICVIPAENNFAMSLNYKKIITPSTWVKNLYSKWLPNDKIEVWPVGIEQNYFIPTSENKNTQQDCIIYFKRRNEHELRKVVKLLDSHNQTFDILSYGSYNEQEFLNKIQSSKYVFLLNGTESQGIAVGEIMSCNIPIFCWDITSWEDYGPVHSVPATSVPYWNNTIGIKVNSEEELGENFVYFLKNLFTFQPRSYILDNLTLEKGAENLLNIFNL